MYYHIHAKFHSQDVTGSGFMTERGVISPPGSFNVKKPTLVRVKTIYDRAIHTAS